MVNRGLIISASVILLAGGMLALRFPVLIGAYDQFGFQIQCGTGYSADLIQASSADDERTSHQHNSTAPGPSTKDYVGQCGESLLTRRLWAVPAAALGGSILMLLTAAALVDDMRHRRGQRRADPVARTPGKSIERSPDAGTAGSTAAWLPNRGLARSTGLGAAPAGDSGRHLPRDTGPDP